MQHAGGGGATVKGSPRPGPAEDLGAAPGSLGERVHADGSVTRIDGGGRCRIVAGVGPDGSSVLVHQDDGRSWHRAVPGPGGGSRYELHLSDVVISAREATFTAIHRPGGGWILVVLEGTVQVTGPADGAVQVSALEAVKVSAGGRFARPRPLTPGEVVNQPWVVRNRSRDQRVLRRPPYPLPRLPPPAPRARPRPERQPAPGHLPGRLQPVARRLSGRVRPRLGKLVVLAVVVSLLALPPDDAPAMSVSVNGRAVHIWRSRPTVANAMLAAALRSQDGALLAAASGAVLDPHYTPAIIVVNGSPASPDTNLGEGARVRVVAPPDVVEPTGSRRVAVPPAPLPDVEHTLWYPGTSGLEDQTYGLVSGEVVARTPVAEPRPSRPELGNVVALTFDDGPHPLWTPQILEILASESVVATFCVVGVLGRRHPDLVRAVLDAGHALCNHTENHAVGLDRADPETVMKEIGGGTELLETIVGTTPPLYRPPAGSLSPAVNEVAHRGGMRVLHWSVDSRDYLAPPPEKLVADVLAAIRPGAVVLLHDGDGDRSSTVAALRPLIQQLRERGFAFATPLAPPVP